jgi:endonuclease YncB( thermonuclease family)
MRYASITENRKIAVLLSAGLLISCEAPGSISGSATVIDGDGLRIGATEIRLHAIDAPEALQLCGEGGSAWPCGRTATDKLRELIGTRPLECTQKDIDSYDRTVAVCTQGDVDLGAEMVRAGLALAYRRFGDDYVDEEDEARAARRGIWSGPFTPPWEWRRISDDAPFAEPPRSTPPGECRIKGNMNRNGERIYHLPGSESYEETEINRPGERWFCTEEEARSEGWRPPRG